MERSRKRTTFQYHTGPIKSEVLFCQRVTLTEGFNTTLVQLKVSWVVFGVLVWVCFNTTLVQLKGQVLGGGAQDSISFNTTLVQLKEQKNLQLSSLDSCVSIPHWSN